MVCVDDTHLEVSQHSPRRSLQFGQPSCLLPSQVAKWSVRLLFRLKNIYDKLNSE